MRLKGNVQLAGVLLILLTSVSMPADAQENVTIPKSRLEELERKEAELEKLRKASKSNEPNQPDLPQTNRVAPTSQTVPVRPIAPANSLPRLTADETVNALDLAGHYAANVATADQRYRDKTFKLSGEIERFEKPMFVRNYKLILRTAERRIRIVCDVRPPDRFTAIFKVNNGSGLAAHTAGGVRESIAQVADIVVVTGRCRGLKEDDILMDRCELTKDEPAQKTATP
jgi:hypothetical protein